MIESSDDISLVANEAILAQSAACAGRESTEAPAGKLIVLVFIWLRVGPAFLVSSAVSVLLTRAVFFSHRASEPASTVENEMMWEIPVWLFAIAGMVITGLILFFVQLGGMYLRNEPGATLTLHDQQCLLKITFHAQRDIWWWM